MPERLFPVLFCHRELLGSAVKSKWRTSRQGYKGAGILDLISVDFLFSIASIANDRSRRILVVPASLNEGPFATRPRNSHGPPQMPGLPRIAAVRETAMPPPESTHKRPSPPRERIVGPTRKPTFPRGLHTCESPAHANSPSRRGGLLARQADDELGEFVRSAVDLDRAAVLLGDDVVADRQAQSRAFAGRLGGKERLK